MANRNQQHNQGGTPRSGTSNRGFASMDAAQQREIARLGGEAVSGNREHMAQIGRKGGEASAESRANARSARARASGDATTTVGRTSGSQYTDDHASSQRSRIGESDAGNRTLNARARSDDDGSRRLGASGRDDGMDRNLGARSRDESAGKRNLGGGDQADNRGLSGRSRDADRDENGASRGDRGNPVGSPRRDRDE
jgi:general stress protein YciG